jgi:hypothetical protein
MGELSLSQIAQFSVTQLQAMTSPATNLTADQKDVLASTLSSGDYALVFP